MNLKKEWFLIRFDKPIEDSQESRTIYLEALCRRARDSTHLARQIQTIWCPEVESGNSIKTSYCFVNFKFYQ